MDLTETVVPETPGPIRVSASHKPSLRQYIRLAWRIVSVRLRFLLLLGAIFLVAGKWENIRLYWDKLTRTPATSESAVSADTEYWCPMCPGVLSDWPGKCAVCNMALVRRKKGEAVPLPDGVLARMQFSPYRIQLAGIRTSTIGFQPLTREVVSVGKVGIDPQLQRRIATPLTGNVEKIWVTSSGSRVKRGDPVISLYSEQAIDEAGVLTLNKRLAFLGLAQSHTQRAANKGEKGFQVMFASPTSGRLTVARLRQGQRLEVGAHLFEVADESRMLALVEVFDRDIPLLVEASPVEARSEAFPGHAPFLGRVGKLVSQTSGEMSSLAIQLYLDNPRWELRPGMVVTASIRTSMARLQWYRKGPARSWMTRTAVDLMAQAVFGQPGFGAVAGLEPFLRAAMQTMHYRHWHVLAVPASAVVDTGSEKIVYVESSPGMFDALQVWLGPRCGAYYPVFRGLEAGQRVATAGAFLIDAETRLNPAAASLYFGSGKTGGLGNTQGKRTGEQAAIKAARAKLNPDDRRLADEQDYCPVMTGSRLGSMGAPVKVMIRGQGVLLCCSGCTDQALAKKDKTLAKVKELKNQRQNEWWRNE